METAMTPRPMGIVRIANLESQVSPRPPHPPVISQGCGQAGKDWEGWGVVAWSHMISVTSGRFSPVGEG